MSRQFQWLRATVDDRTISDFRAAMLRDSYGATRAWGFIVAASSSEHIEGMYIERRQSWASICDPIRGETKELRTKIARIRFRITKTAPEIELLDPPKDLQSFLSRLSEYTHFTVKMTTPRVDLEEWFSFLSPKMRAARIVSISSCGFDLAKNVYSTVRIDGTDDVRHYLQGLRYEHTSISRIAVKSSDGFTDLICELFADGRAKIQSSDGSFASLLRETIEPALQKKKASLEAPS